MKNDPNALNIILSGKLVLPPGGEYFYITADTGDPEEFIFIPQEFSVEYSNLWPWEELMIPGVDDCPVKAKCFVLDNKTLKEKHFTWIEGANCWAYYYKS